MPLSKKLQELVDRISLNREKLLSSISGLRDAQINHKQHETDWSICDILNHVALVDEANAKLTSNMLKKALANNPRPDPSADGSEMHAMDHLFPKLKDQKFQAPELFKPHPQSTIDESLAKLKVSRERMLANLQQLDGYDLTELTYPHPAAGELNAYQWIIMAGVHESRHADQINIVKSKPGFPQSSSIAGG